MLPEPRVQGDVSSAAAGVLLILNTAQLTNTHNTTDRGYIGDFNLEYHESEEIENALYFLLYYRVHCID